MAVEAARKYPERFAVMGQFPPTRPELRHLIRGWKNQPGMLGLRWALLHPEEQVWLRDGTLDWLWPAAEQEGLPVSCMGGLFLKEFRQIAEAHPNLKMILDHCGLVRTGPDPRDGRGKLVYLTEAGRAAREAGVAAAAGAIGPVAAGLTPAELEAALPTLRRLRAALDAARDAEEPGGMEGGGG
jgi:predicted TIM-barrel fold metal-dependent hydrolase